MELWLVRLSPPGPRSSWGVVGRKNSLPSVMTPSTSNSSSLIFLARDLEQNLTGARLLAHLPIAQLFAVIGDADLLGMLQIVRKFPRRLVSLSWVALHSAVDDFLHLRRDAGINLSRRHRVIQQPVVHDDERVRAREWHLSGEHLVEHHAQSVDIAAGVASLAFDLLGRNVVRGAHGL